MTRTQVEDLKLALQAHVQRANMFPPQVSLMKAALDRIAAGDYGRCARCGGEIGMARLTALPHARFCIPCQENGATYASHDKAERRRLT